MRVLMFGWEFPPHISGGLGTACSGITRGLSSLGDVDILFVVPKTFGDENQPNIKLLAAGDADLTRYPDLLNLLKTAGRYIEIESRLVPYLDPEQYEKAQENKTQLAHHLTKPDAEGKLHFSGSYGSGLLTEISNYAVTAGVIARDHAFDLIHAHDWLTYPAGIAAKKASGKPLIAHVHATDFDRSGGHANPQVYKIEREGMEMADKVITVSNLTRESVITRYRINPDKVVTVHNAVEPVKQTAPFPKAAGPDLKTVTFLGRITLQKGPEYFIKAAHLVLQKMNDVRFVMAGSGDLMEEMIRLAARLEISSHFHFPGFLKGQEVRQMLESSDVLVMPSVSEPFGITPLEAMQAGVPVIISNQSGVAEVLSGVIKTDYWDIHAIADAIHGLLQYQALSRMLSVNGKKEVACLKWEDAARHIYDVYKSLLTA